LNDRADVVGRRAEELFPEELGKSYTLQDQVVLSGEIINDQLELHLRPNNATGWCLTSKRPIIERGQVLGLIGIPGTWDDLTIGIQLTVACKICSILCVDICRTDTH